MNITLTGRRSPSPVIPFVHNLIITAMKQKTYTLSQLNDRYAHLDEEFATHLLHLYRTTDADGKWTGVDNVDLAVKELSAGDRYKLIHRIWEISRDTIHFSNRECFEAMEMGTHLMYGWLPNYMTKHVL